MAGQIPHSLVKALRTVPEFVGLDDRTLLHVVGASMNLFWRAGTPVFGKGEPSEAIYIVLTGRVRIVDPERDQAEVLVGPGESFGELSLLLRRTHSRRAEAVEDTELMVLPESSFQELLDSSPDLQALFRRKIEARAP